jgi:hypothetical protein
VCRSHFAVMQATQALGTLTTLWTPSKRYYRINLSHLSKRAGDPIVRGWVCPNTNPRATQGSPWLTFLLTNLTSRGTYKIATSLHHWRAKKNKIKEYLGYLSQWTVKTSRCSGGFTSWRTQDLHHRNCDGAFCSLVVLCSDNVGHELQGLL